MSQMGWHVPAHDDYASRCGLVADWGPERVDLDKRAGQSAQRRLQTAFRARAVYPRPLLMVFDMDVSATQRLVQSPWVEAKTTDTFLTTERAQLRRLREPTEIEYDVWVRMPPRESYTLEATVEYVRRAKPRIVVPNEVL